MQFGPFSEFCESLGLSPAQCTIQHKGKQIDVQSPYRFLNLHTGADLSVHVSKGSSEALESPVRVAVQTQDGRHVSTVSCGSSLQQVLQAALPSVGPHDLAQCTVVYMRRELPSDALQQPLTALGISSGSAVFRVSFAASTPPAAASGGGQSAQPPVTPTSHDTSAHDGTTIKASGSAQTSTSAHAAGTAVAGGTDDADGLQGAVHTSPEHVAQTLCSAVRDAMFDVDAVAALGLVLKLLDNVLRKPGQASVRRVRLGNAKIVPLLGRHAAPLALLLAAGFHVEYDGAALNGALALGDSQALLQAAAQAQQVPARNVIALDTAHENVDTVLAVRRAVAHELSHGLGQTPPGEPDVQAAAAAAAAASAAAAEFDIYKGMVMSTASRPGRPQPHELAAAAGGGDGVGRSKYARELQALQDREAEIRAAFPHSASNPPNRDTFVLLPSALPGYNPAKFVDAPVSGGVAVYTPPPDTGVGSAGSSTPSDSAVVMGMIRARVEESEKSQRFRSQAERDVEAARKKRVYPDALLRIMFPDRVLLQGRFASDETIGAVQQWVQSCLSTATVAAQVKLYVTPPRKDLPEDDTLESLSLVPAALVYASWVGDTPAACTAGQPGGYLQPALLEAAEEFAQQNSSTMQNQLHEGQAAAKAALAKPANASADVRKARLDAMAKRLLGKK